MFQLQKINKKETTASAQPAENNQLEKSIRQAIREELAGVSISGSGESVSKKEEIPSQMLDFLSGLEDAF